MLFFTWLVTTCLLCIPLAPVRAARTDTSSSSLLLSTKAAFTDHYYSLRLPAGTLRVTVTDAQQHSLGGVTCSLIRTSDPAKVVATALTDSEGVATLVEVARGEYILTVESTGFEIFKKNHVVIKDHEIIELKIVLAVAALSANVTISSPDEETTSVAAGATTPSGNLRRKTLERLPLATARVDEALPLIPGVVRSSTGEISMKGASEQQSILLINGLNASDPASGNFRLNLPTDAVEAVQVFLHPYTAEYGQFTGGVTRIETRRGGDKWSVELNDFFPDFRFKNGKIVGVAEDLPRLNFNGPLIKNRLYLSQSLSYAIAKNPVRGLAFPVNETKTEAQNYFTQIDLVLNSRHTQTYTFGYFPERKQFIGLDFFRPQPTTANYKQKDFVFAARDHYAFGHGLLETAISFNQFSVTVWGQGTNEHTFTPTIEEGNYFATQDRHSRRLEFFTVYQFPTEEFLGSSHDIKVGIDLNRVSNQMTLSARPVNIVRGDSSRAERITFDAVPEIRVNSTEYIGFAQDRWMVRSNLSLDLGLRYENQIAEEQNFAPRAGFAWSPLKNDRTVIRGGVGLFFDKVPLNIRSFGNYPARTVTRYGPDGVSIIEQRHFVNVPVSTTPIAPLDFRQSTVTAGFVPKNLTWNLQLDKIVNSYLTLRANLVNSRTEHLYIVNPELDFCGQSAIVLRPSGRATYHALELTARFQLPRESMFYLTYLRSRSRGDLNDFNSYFGDFGAPIIRQNQYSNSPFDVPNRFLAWGTFSLPHRITIAPIFEVRSGFPYSVRDAEQNFVGLRNSDQTRFPRFLALDVEVAKEFQVTKKYAIRLSLSSYNVTNHFNPSDVRSNIGAPRFGEFSASYRRYFTGGFDIIF